MGPSFAKHLEQVPQFPTNRRNVQKENGVVEVFVSDHQKDIPTVWVVFGWFNNLRIRSRHIRCGYVSSFSNGLKYWTTCGSVVQFNIAERLFVFIRWVSLRLLKYFVFNCCVFPGEFENFNLIEAKVPILRFRDRHNYFEVDLNFNNCVGIKNTHLLYCYSQSKLISFSRKFPC